MARQRTLKLLFFVFALGMMACNLTNPFLKSQPAPVGVVATQIPTSAPTVWLPTARPTNTPAPPTPVPTLVVKPSATLTALPSPIPSTYIVQEGDTLSGLAARFNLPLEALARANGLNENDFLLVGQEIIIAISETAEVPTSPAPAEAVVIEPLPTPQAEALVSTGAQAVPLTTLPPPPVSQAVPLATQPPPAPPPPLIPSGPPPPVVSYGGNINPLTGLPVDNPANLQRRPLLVRIGNDASARQSQAGLNSADIVYEEVAEWWVTRFTAIFLSKTPTLVAPIRSARLINVQLAPQYQGALAHSGGSDPVRWEISHAPIVNLDEFYNRTPYFYRPNAGWQTRLALDTQAARTYMASQGLEAPVRLESFFFSQALDQGEPAPNVYVPYPGSTSFTQWSYDPASGKYLRWISGYPLYDLNGGQVAAANVIIYFADHQATNIVEDSNGATSIRIIVNGRGPAWFFRDGRLNRGYWQTDGYRPPYFSYENGTPYTLKPGNSWVEVIPPYFKIGLNSPEEASSRR